MGGLGAQTSEAEVVPKPKRKKPSSRRSTLNRNLETDDSSYRDEPTTSSRGQTQLSMPETLVKPKRPRIQKLAFTKTMSEDAETKTIIPIMEEITPDGLYEAFANAWKQTKQKQMNSGRKGRGSSLQLSMDAGTLEPSKEGNEC